MNSRDKFAALKELLGDKWHRPLPGMWERFAGKLHVMIDMDGDGDQYRMWVAKRGQDASKSKRYDYEVPFYGDEVASPDFRDSIEAMNQRMDALGPAFKTQGALTRWVRKHLEAYQDRTFAGDLERARLQVWAVEAGVGAGSHFPELKMERYFRHLGVPRTANGFDLLPVEKVFSQEAKPVVSQAICSGRIPEGHVWTEAEESDFRAVAQDVLDFLKGLPGPVRFLSGYSYTFDRDNPLKVTASDGSEIELEFLSDMDKYGCWKGEFLEAVLHEERGKFGQGKVNQETHEAEMMGL